MTVDDAAEYLNVSKWTLYGWARSGSGPERVLMGGTVRYQQKALNKWVDENVEPRRDA